VEALPLVPVLFYKENVIMKTKNIYRILANLLKYAGQNDFDNQLISAEKLKMSYSEWEQLMILLQKNGYVDGVIYTQTLSDRFPKITDISHVTITLDGIEYVEENSTMKKVGDALKMAGEIFG
jgi:dihydrolipoyl dehydrogenase